MNDSVGNDSNGLDQGNSPDPFDRLLANLPNARIEEDGQLCGTCPIGKETEPHNLAVHRADDGLLWFACDAGHNIHTIAEAMKSTWPNDYHGQRRKSA